MNKNRKSGLFGNALLLLILCFEAAGFAYSIRNRGITIFAYYTQISNILTAVSVTALLISGLSGRSFVIITALRYTSVCMLMLTAVITLGLIAPSGQVPLGDLLFSVSNNGLYHHLLCPILSVMSYIRYEPHIKPKSAICLPVLCTLIYGSVMMTLNGLRLFDGPYPFLKVLDQSVLADIGWTAAILSLTLLLSALIMRLSKSRIFLRSLSS